MHVGRDPVGPAGLQVRRARLSPTDLRVGQDQSLTAGLLSAKPTWMGEGGAGFLVKVFSLFLSRKLR